METTIRPPSKISLGLRELWLYRELFYFFSWRDIKVKYKQTYLGVLWALLQPLGMMLIFTLLFSKALKIPSGVISHYPVLVFSGLIIWNLFNNSVTRAAENNSNFTADRKRCDFFGPNTTFNVNGYLKRIS